MIKLLIFLILLVLVIIGLTIHHFLKSFQRYQYIEQALPENFDHFYKDKLKISKEKNARSKNEERLIRYSPGKTPIAILYIHGFGASRAEGELVVDRISQKFEANTYYMRLPGHGTNMEDHAETTMEDHLHEAITALRMLKKLGTKTIIIGTSFGGCIATYLAAEYPKQVQGIILCAPFYNFASATARLIYFYPIFKLINHIMPIRIDNTPVPKEKDNWTHYWYREQKLQAVEQVVNMTNLVAKKSVYHKVTSPVLLLYYYKDKENQDALASVSHMKHAFAEFGKDSRPNPLNRAIPIINGNHVLMSRYVKSDWDRVERQIIAFITEIQ